MFSFCLVLFCCWILVGTSQLAWMNRQTGVDAPLLGQPGSAGVTGELTPHCLLVTGWVLGALELISSPVYLLHFFA